MINAYFWPIALGVIQSALILVYGVAGLQVLILLQSHSD